MAGDDEGGGAASKVRALPVVLRALLLASIALTGFLATAAGDETSPRDREALRDPAVQRDADAQVEGQRGDRSRRSSDDARADRRHSRTRYRGASRSEAIDVGRRHFPEVVSRALWRPWAPPKGASITRYVGSNAALIRQENGTHAVLESTMPLLALEPSGEQAPVATELEAQGTGFVPRNPLARTTLPGEIGDGVAFHDLGVSVRLEGAAAEGSVVGEKLFYPNALTDTDYIVAPLPTGVETFVQLRSEDSPERHALLFDLPSDAWLEETVGDPPGVAIATREGELARIGRPVAWDADGQRLAVEYAIDGNRLVVSVDHRDRDVRYPVLVDPPIIENQRYWHTNGGIDQNGWTHDNSGWIFASRSGDWGAGLYGFTQDEYDVFANDQLNWRFRAPSQSYVEQAWFDFVRHAPPAWGGFTCVSMGIYHQGAGDWDSEPWTNCGNVLDQSILALPTRNGGRDDNESRFSFWVYGVYGTRLADWAIGYLGGSYVLLNDRYDPGGTHSASSAWTHTATPVLDANDRGLGVKRGEIRSPSHPTWLGYNLQRGCNGDRNSRCFPTGWNRPYSTDDSPQVPEGTVTLRATSVDAVERRSGALDTTVRIDRTRPNPGLSGRLWEQRGKSVGGQAELVVSPTDSHSGVQSVEVLVDGQSQASTTYACGESCPSAPPSFRWTFDSSKFAEGERRIKVLVKDKLGSSRADHVSTTEWIVYNDDRSPGFTGSGPLWDMQDQIISDGRYELTVDAYDGDETLESSGVRAIEIYVGESDAPVWSDSVSCTTRNCTMARTWTLDTADYADGPLGIEVVVRDEAGNQVRQNLGVVINKIESQPRQTLDLGAPDQAPALKLDGASVEGRAGHSVTGLDDVNGDGIDDFAVGAPRAAHSLRPNGGAVYVIYGGSTEPVDLAALGARGFRVDGASPGDLAGSAVANGGDVNGDGLGDLVVGAPAKEGALGALPLQGHVYVVFGAPASGDVDLAALGTRGFRIDGPLLTVTGAEPLAGLTATPFGAHLGGPRAGAVGTVSADVNGDELDDVVIGSPAESPGGRASAGTAYVVFGKAGTAPVDSQNLGTQGFRIDGAAPNDRAGHAVAVVGDLNADDLADIALTSPGALPGGRVASGAAAVVFGKSDTAPVNLGALGASGYSIHGPAGGEVGNSLAALGDTDGDALADFALGGRDAWVVFGKAGSEPNDLAGPDFHGYQLPAPSAAHGPATVAGAGDLNDDTAPDVLVGFPSSRDAAGSAYAVLSIDGDHPPSAPVPLNDLLGQEGAEILGAAAGERFGQSLDGIEDVGGEPAFVVGAPESDAAAVNGGSVYVVRSTQLVGGHPSTSATYSPPAGSGSVAAAQSTSAKRKCAARGVPYRYHSFRDHPTCRYTINRNVERTPVSPRKGYKERGYVLGVAYSIFQRKRKRESRNSNAYAAPKRGKDRLEPNPQTNTRKWPLVDSFGKTFAWVEYKSRGVYTVYDEAGTGVMGTTKRGSGTFVMLQGRGCMSSESLENRHAIVILWVVDSKNSVDTGRNIGLRGYIDRAALPANGYSTRGFDNNTMIDTFWVSCNNRMKNKGAGNIGRRAQDQPRFVITDRYQGSKTRGKLTSGTTYDNYTVPAAEKTPGQSNLDPPVASDALLVSSSTSGVFGGGIGRALFKTPRDVWQRDDIGYTDHNVPCNGKAVARWTYVTPNLDAQGRPSSRLRPMWGWVPNRVPDGYERSKAAGSSECP